MEMEGAKAMAEAGSRPAEGALDEGNSGGRRKGCVSSFVGQECGQNAFSGRADEAFYFTCATVIKGGAEPLGDAQLGAEVGPLGGNEASALVREKAERYHGWKCIRGGRR